MKLAADFFQRRITERLRMETGNAPVPDAGVLAGWDPDRVSQFLRRALDTEDRAMERVVIIGAGGHAKVIIEILEELGQFEIAGCTSKEAGEPVLGLPVLGDDTVLPELYARGVRHAFVALGNNSAREQMIKHLTASGFSLINVISPRALISPRTRFGRGVAVMPGAIINVASEIGDGAIVNTGATIDHDCRIGACAHIAPGVNLAGCVAVGEGAFLGVGSRVIPGISIGPWTVVGAGAVVIRDLPGSVTAVGIPAAVRPRTA